MTESGSVSDFYDKLTPYYHLVFQDWPGSITRQSERLDAIIRDEWGDGVGTILDASCGIGTQTFALHAKGYELTASDLSPAAIERARTEASSRDASISFSVADMRRLSSHHRAQHDLVISGDNSVPHLLTDDDILQTFREFYSCTRPGGGCLITVRDYDKENLSGSQVKPYGVRYDGDTKYMVLQLWEFDDSAHYTVSMYFIEDGAAGCATHVFKTRYYAIGTDRLEELMTAAGFRRVHRIDGRFYQPVVVGTRPSD